jgi:hypothetical protein
MGTSRNSGSTGLMMIFPPSSFETTDYFPCELCGQERNGNELIDIKGHSVCPECAYLIQDESIDLPSILSRKKPSLRAILIQIRDLSILIIFIFSILLLVKQVSKKAMEHRSKNLETVLKESGREMPSKQ